MEILIIVLFAVGLVCFVVGIIRIICTDEDGLLLLLACLVVWIGAGVLEVVGAHITGAPLE